MQLLNKLFFALKFKQLSSIIKAFGWFENDLQMLLICRLKFNLTSKGILKISTDEIDLIVYGIVKGMFVRLDFLLSRIMAWNFSGLKIILFYVNQLIAILLSDSNVSHNVETFFRSRQGITISKIMDSGYVDEEKQIIDCKVEQNRPEYRTLRYTGNNFVIVACFRLLTLS